MIQTTPCVKKRVTQPELLIPTATAIVCSADDPHFILVGESAKHKKPVLPGGKIDVKDLCAASLEKCAEVCMRRELFEEIGAEPGDLRLLVITADSERDVRRVNVKALRGSIVEDLLGDLPADAQVTGRHGVPDFLFLLKIAPERIAASEELTRLHWIDCRLVTADSLGAGHGKLVMHYAQGIAHDRGA